MTYTFKTLLVPPAQEPIATLIANEVGYPDKGMFVATFRDGPPPPIGQPDPRPIQGYASSGAVDDTSPFLANDSQDMLDMIFARNPDATVTLPQCAELIEFLDTTVGEPLGRISFMQGELNGVPIQQAWVRPTTEEPGYALDALVSRAGSIWRNLVEDNKEQPAIGRNGWRKVWSP